MWYHCCSNYFAGLYCTFVILSFALVASFSCNLTLFMLNGDKLDVYKLVQGEPPNFVCLPPPR